MKIKIDSSETTKAMGSLFVKRSATGKSMKGCTFVLPKKKYESFLESVGGSDGTVRFMGMPVLSHNGKEIILTEPLEKESAESFVIAKEVKRIVQETAIALTANLRESLEREGYKFKSDAKLFYFCRNRVKVDRKVEGNKTFDYVMLGDKVLFSYEVAHDRND